MNYDVVYYWTGGAERGEWREVDVHGAGGDLGSMGSCWVPNARELVARLERMGYVAVPGRRSIGAPEGPPSEAQATRG